VKLIAESWFGHLDNTPEAVLAEITGRTIYIAESTPEGLRLYFGDGTLLILEPSELYLDARFYELNDVQ
jgi:hypothetical protein